MDDRFEAMLARRLTTYAEARIRAIDPVLVATAAVAAAASPALHLRFGRRIPPGRVRWLVLGAAAALVLGSGILFVIGGPPSATLPPTPPPSASAAPLGSAEVGIDLRQTVLEESSWQLDFAGSGLDPRVDPGMNFDIASGIDFTDGRFEGGTGYGGGCDSFAGTYALGLDSFRFTFETLRQACGQGSPQQIVERLVATRRFTLTECTAPLVGPSPTPLPRCGTLTLFPDSGIGLLIYSVR